jgi:hypothetical protein
MRVHRLPLTLHLVAVSGAAVAGLLACHDIVPPDRTTLRLEKAALESGDGQVDTVLRTLATPFRVRVMNAAGPVGGVAVRWRQLQPVGVEVTREASSDATGIASVTWTLGPVPGTHVIEATVVGRTESPVVFTAVGMAPVLKDASVSNPIATDGTVGDAPAGLRVDTSARPVYVSLRPGTIAGAIRARVRHPQTSAFAERAMLDGGFDPVQLMAHSGDELQVEIEMADGTVRYYRAPVPARTPPGVVRVAPPPRKRDVPLNSLISVVFTEPVAPGSVTSETFMLQHGGTAVAGTVTVSADGLRADFVPGQLLAVNTDYSIVVAADIRDLDGENIGDALSSEFTTAVSATAPASLTITPDQPALMAETEFYHSRARLSAILRDATGAELSTGQMQWEVDDERIATIDSAGLVTAMRPGTATVTATAQGVTGSTTITVLPRIARLMVTPGDTALRIGDSVRVTAAIFDSVGMPITAYHIGWSVPANLGVVTSASGGSVTVKALKSGVLYVRPVFQPITGGWATEGFGARIAVTSSNPPAFVRLFPETLRIVPGSRGYSASVRAEVTDSAGEVVAFFWQTDEQVIEAPAVMSWNSSNHAIVSRSSPYGFVNRDNGHIYNNLLAREPGTATITASLGALTGSMTVIVDHVTLSSVSSGFGHFCALTTSGAAHCTPGAIGNQFGQLGHGAAGESAYLAGVSGGHKFTSITTGADFACALSETGAAYCWGNNSAGRLGTGGRVGACNELYPDADCSAVPVAVSGGLSFAQISSGWAHTCAMDSAGRAYCWGDNAVGQLGDGSTTTRSAPAPVGGDLRFTQITTGGDHSCGLTDQGIAYCWGSNAMGQLGNGSFTDAPTPTRVPGETRFSRIDAGWFTTCGITGDGAAYCWGIDFVGEAGSPEVANRPAPVRLSMPDGVALKEIDLGDRWNCALDTTGAAYCWGWDWHPDAANVVYPPTKVPGGLVFVSLSSACGVTAEPAVYCGMDPTRPPTLLEGQRP